ncbi:hypothetical protein PVAP13_5KG134600 [Panicum virgatum]|uniref:Uncharacterized protein n=1 Tax=Panicum virgatum TaxID=38727 RepID=A0A8T0SFP3_PANVG|nr:hypothetical protein PVAP13_5KG134600 [Panicum virgatum]
MTATASSVRASSAAAWAPARRATSIILRHLLPAMRSTRRRRNHEQQASSEVRCYRWDRRIADGRIGAGGMETREGECSRRYMLGGLRWRRGGDLLRGFPSVLIVAS